MTRRRRAGAILWILCLLTFPAQMLAAAQWPEPYSWPGNTISDLGVTGCGMFDAGTRVERYICSPAHALANGATVANGVLLATGAALLWSSWPRLRAGRVAMAFLILGGLLVAVVGVLPWDVEPDGHNAAALGQALAQWAGMLLLAASQGRSTAGRWAAALTVACLLLSMAGFVLFIGAVAGGPPAGLGLGITERLAFDTLTVWGAALGILVAATGPRHGPQVRSNQPGAIERIRSTRR